MNFHPLKIILNRLIQNFIERMDYRELLDKLKRNRIAYSNLNTMADVQNHPALGEHDETIKMEFER